MRKTTYISESSGGRTEMSLEAEHLSGRTIMLTGEVNDDMATDFASKMLFLTRSADPINIILDSPGGSVNAGLVIYDIIRECDGKIPINIYCMGMAASMGAVILAGGHKGRRYILPHSKCMIHEPLIRDGVGGSATSISKTAESILETKKVTNGILAMHTGKTIEEIDEATSFDNYMNAGEAIEFGLCDEIKCVIGG